MHLFNLLCIDDEMHDEFKHPPALSDNERMKRTVLLSPEIIIDALHDRIHPASGRLLTTKNVCILNKNELIDKIF